MQTIHSHLSRHQFFSLKLLKLAVAALLFTCALPCFSQQKPSDVELLSSQPMTISDGCEQYISVSGTNSIMESKKFLIIERGSYQYLLKIVMNPEGALGTIYSIRGELFNPNDELVFVNSQNSRIALRLDAVNKADDQYEATFPLNAEAVKWLGADPVTVVYLKNNVKSQMLKFSINEERSAYFHQTMKCFLDLMY